MKTKKLISLILTVLMLVSASALFTLPSSAAVTGTCGPDVYFTLDDGVLTVTGSGMMYYFHYQDAPLSPWYDYAESITTVYIEVGVTSIGLNAFENCVNITDVYYAGSKHDWSLVSIYGGNEAFLDATLHYGIVNEDEYWDWAIEDGVLYITGKGTMDSFRGMENKRPWASQLSKITKVVVCDGLTSVGASAFTDMSNLKEVVCGRDVTSIGMDAFSYCTKLTTIVFNGPITEIGQGTVYSCSALSKVTVTGQTKNQFISIANRYLYNEQYSRATFTVQEEGSAVIYPAVTVLYGDVNGDGAVNKKDSLALKKYLADDTNPCDLAAADVNVDGEVNKKDSLRLKQWLAGFDVVLGPET